MNAWAGKTLGTVLTLMLVAALGCAPAQTIWMSSPDAGIVSNKHFEARLVPLKREDGFYRAFRLEVKNLTGNDLAIDWNRTTYTHEGRKNGRFVYEGITPGDVKDKSIPAETIPAGGNFSRDVYPFNLLSKAPLRTSGVSQGIRGGMMPEGENGMQLVIMYEGKALVENLSVVLTEEEGL
jgi:hypothetical protein